MTRLRAVIAVLAALATVLLSTPRTAEASSSWAWPLHGSPLVLRGLDLPAQSWLPGHRGVDLAGRAGMIVLAAGDGVVRFAGTVAGVGVVSISHDTGLVTTYQPVAASVRAGDVVRAGQPIGRLTRRGSHCATPCLHWGLRRGLDYLDPLALVGAGRVRLLPLGGPSAQTPAGALATTGLALACLGAVGGRRRVSRRRSSRRPPAPRRAAGPRSPAPSRT
jgi:murein DD-endopeptidase MepM/ murein hydrolase activator NlpD